MDRGQLIKKLKGVDGEFWIGGSGGYGSSGTLYYITAEGIICVGSVGRNNVVSVELDTESFLDAKGKIQNDINTDLDTDELAIILGGGKPEITYYRPNPEYFYTEEDEIYTSYDEAEEAAFDQLDIDFTILEKWEDMDNDVLFQWNKCLEWIEKGVKSTFDVDFIFP